MISKLDIIKRLDIPALITELVPSCRKSGAHYSGLCPFHDDHKPSLIVSPTIGIFKCMACRAKGSIFYLYGKTHDLDFKGSITELADRVGLADIKRTITGSYSYHDPDGSLLYWKERVEPGNRKPKGFYFYHGDRQTGRGCDSVLYSLHKIKTATTVIFCEGERKADVLNGWNMPGITGTTLDSGSNSNPTKGMIEILTGKNVFILPDNDKPGLSYALNLANALYAGTLSAGTQRYPGIYRGADTDTDGFICRRNTGHDATDAANSSLEILTQAV